MGVCQAAKRLHQLPSREPGERLGFAIMQLADVWINGEHVIRHAGGYTTFVVDATGFLKAGENELLVRLDNHDNPLIPPGKPIENLDFCYHSGIYRNVHLIHKQNVFITHSLLANKEAGGGIFVTYPHVSAEQATVAVQTEVANSSLADKLLRVRQELYEWTTKGLGKYLNGTNRHQEYPYVGNAISDQAQYRDVCQMREAGFNTVRLGHYPQACGFCFLSRKRRTACILSDGSRRWEALLGFACVRPWFHGIQRRVGNQCVVFIPFVK